MFEIRKSRYSVEKTSNPNRPSLVLNDHELEYIRSIIFHIDLDKYFDKDVNNMEYMFK